MSKFLFLQLNVFKTHLLNCHQKRHKNSEDVLTSSKISSEVLKCVFENPNGLMLLFWPNCKKILHQRPQLATTFLSPDQYVIRLEVIEETFLIPVSGVPKKCDCIKTRFAECESSPDALITLL